MRQLLSAGNCIDETIDLSIVKSCDSPPPSKLHIEKICDRSTQTEINIETESKESKNEQIQIKKEPIPDVPPSVKKENNSFNLELDSDHFDQMSSDSEDISLKTLKTKKSKKPAVNGEVTPKRGRKKNVELQGWEDLMTALPAGALSVVDRENLPDLQVQVMKEELDEQPCNSDSLLTEMNVFHCCICLVQCYNRNEMIQHYKYVFLYS